LHDCFVLWLTSNHHDDPIHWRIFANMFLYSLFYAAAATSANLKMVSLHAAQNDLAQEKESFDALLTMMCDCKILLAANGRTVIRSDARFTSIVGTDVDGCDFTSLLDTIEASRFQSAFDPCQPELLQPTMLPTTLLGAHGSQVVDLFLVDRRPVDQRMHGGDSTVGFLMGVRTTGPLISHLEGSCATDIFMRKPGVGSSEGSETSWSSTSLSSLLRQVDEMTIYFDGFSDNLSVQRLEMTCAPPSDDVWCPVLKDFILEPWDKLFMERCQEVINAAFNGRPKQEKGIHVGTIVLHFGSNCETLTVDAEDLKITADFESSVDSSAPITMSVRFCNFVFSKVSLRGSRRLMSICEEGDGGVGTPLSHAPRPETTVPDRMRRMMTL